MARRSRQETKGQESAAAEPAALDRLFSAPLDDFVAVRNEVAAELRKAGDAEGAARVRGLRRPPAGVWAVNQLARRHAAGVAGLLAAGARLREAQVRALSGGGLEELHAASRAEREAVERLVASAEALLRDAGNAASAATLEVVRRTLNATATASDEERRMIQRGTLLEPLQPAGFGEVLGGLLSGVPSAAPPPPPRTKAVAAATPAPPVVVPDRGVEERERRARLRAAIERRAQAGRVAAEIAKRADRLEKDAQGLSREAARLDAEAQRAAREAQAARSKAEAAAAQAAAERAKAEAAAREASELEAEIEHLKR